jgi:hypothetical protein
VLDLYAEQYTSSNPSPQGGGAPARLQSLVGRNGNAEKSRKVRLREPSGLARVSELIAKAADHCFDILILLLTGNLGHGQT